MSGRMPDSSQIWTFQNSFRNEQNWTFIHEPKRSEWTALPQHFKNAGWWAAGAGKLYHRAFQLAICNRTVAFLLEKTLNLCDDCVASQLGLPRTRTILLAGRSHTQRTLAAAAPARRCRTSADCLRTRPAMTLCLQTPSSRTFTSTRQTAASARCRSSLAWVYISPIFPGLYLVHSLTSVSFTLLHTRGSLVAQQTTWRNASLSVTLMVFRCDFNLNQMRVSARSAVVCRPAGRGNRNRSAPPRPDRHATHRLASVHLECFPLLVHEGRACQQDRRSARTARVLRGHFLRGSFGGQSSRYDG
jgi:hypothetical protein